MAGDYNVFAVDWGGGSLPLYTQATANTRVVGLEVAHFIAFLLVCHLKLNYFMALGNYCYVF